MTANVRRDDHADLRDMVRLSQLWADDGIAYRQTVDSIQWLEQHLGDYRYAAEIDGAIVGCAHGAARASDETMRSLTPLGTRQVYVHAARHGVDVGELLTVWRPSGRGGWWVEPSRLAPLIR